MQIQLEGGLPPQRVSNGAVANAPGSVFGEMLVSEFLPPYYALAKSGLVYSLAGAALNPSAFTGGAAGTPLLGLFNPLGSGVDLVLLELILGIRTTGTGAGALDFNHYGVQQGSVAPSGTLTAPRNSYSLGNTGSKGYGMVNVANTGAVASNLLRPSISCGLITATGGVNVGLMRDEIKGEVIIPPGGYYALGSSLGTTAASIDAALMWAEIAV